MNPVDNSLPRKKADQNSPPIPAVPLKTSNKDDEMEVEIKIGVSTNSDSGPDPGSDNAAGWRINIKKRSKRQDKIIAKYCK